MICRLDHRADFVHSSRRQWSVQRPEAIHCKDLKGHSGVIRAIEFSNDGSLLVSGGNRDRPVLIWRMDQIFDKTNPQLVPSVKKVIPKDFKVFSFAISPDNSRIFVGGRNQAVYVHDTQT